MNQLAKLKPFLGRWRIQEMETWEQDFVDLVVDGHFTFTRDCGGMFQFGAVTGHMDCHLEEGPTGEHLEFSWLGDDEGEDTGGRGWVYLKDNELIGRIFIHGADSSHFRATREEKRVRKRLK